LKETNHPFTRAYFEGEGYAGLYHDCARGAITKERLQYCEELYQKLRTLNKKGGGHVKTSV